MKKPSIRDVFAKVADNLNQAGLLPPVARQWTAKGVQSTYYRNRKYVLTDEISEKVLFEIIKVQEDFKLNPKL